MKLGRLRRDDSSHWYLVPEDQVEDFDQMLDALDEYDAESCYDFDIRFGGFRLAGGPEDLKVLMEQ